MPDGDVSCDGWWSMLLMVVVAVDNGSNRDNYGDDSGTSGHRKNLRGSEDREGAAAQPEGVGPSAGQLHADRVLHQPRSGPVPGGRRVLLQR